MEWSALLTLIPPLAALAGLLYWLSSVRKQLLRLDSTWDWLGPGMEYQGSGRVWRGHIGTRRIEVTWFDRNTSLTISGSPRLTAIFRRAAGPAVPARPGEEHFHKVTLPEGLLGWTPEPGRLEELVRQAGVLEALRELLVSERPTIRHARLEPRGASFFARNLWDAALTEQDARRWTQALLVLAHASETSLPGVNECP